MSASGPRESSAKATLSAPKPLSSSHLLLALSAFSTPSYIFLSILQDTHISASMAPQTYHTCYLQTLKSESIVILLHFVFLITLMKNNLGTVVLVYLFIYCLYSMSFSCISVWKEHLFNTIYKVKLKVHGKLNNLYKYPLNRWNSKWSRNIESQDTRGKSTRRTSNQNPFQIIPWSKLHCHLCWCVTGSSS